MKIEGWHGRSDDMHPHDVHDLYLSPGQEHAEDYGDSGLYKVSYEAKNPLVITRAAAFHEAWHSSRAAEAPGRFHPDSTRQFTSWARAQGHDAVHLPQEMFDDADRSEVPEHWETARGTFGDPQSIVLNPKQAKVKRVR